MFLLICFVCFSLETRVFVCYQSIWRVCRFWTCVRLQWQTQACFPSAVRGHSHTSYTQLPTKKTKKLPKRKTAAAKMKPVGFIISWSKTIPTVFSVLSWFTVHHVLPDQYGWLSFFCGTQCLSSCFSYTFTEVADLYHRTPQYHKIWLSSSEASHCSRIISLSTTDLKCHFQCIARNNQWFLPSVKSRKCGCVSKGTILIEHKHKWDVIEDELSAFNSTFF